MSSALRSPVVCLVTDRRRLPDHRPDGLVSLARAAARAGIGLIQVRERDLDARPLFDLTCRILEATAGTRAAVVVNERVDVAIAAGAHGVHLRADSMSAERVRAMAPERFVVGRSVHTREEAIAAARSGVDYIVMGTTYPTPGKPSARLAGVRGLAEVCGAVRVPVLAIGGVTPASLPELARAGASGMAAIGWFSDALASSRSADLEAALTHLVHVTAEAFQGC